MIKHLAVVHAHMHLHTTAAAAAATAVAAVSLQCNLLMCAYTECARSSTGCCAAEVCPPRLRVLAMSCAAVIVQDRMEGTAAQCG
jgi:hypothetical protein